MVLKKERSGEKPRELADVDRQYALQALQAQGLAFLESFGTYANLASSSPASLRDLITSNRTEDTEEEWSGIHLVIAEIHDLEQPGEESSLEEDSDGPTYDPKASGPEVVLFTNSSESKAPSRSGGSGKAFMSSKVNKIYGGTTSLSSMDPGRDTDDENDTHTKNDQELHKLLHSRLLSGSANTDLKLTPAERRRALAGRVLELASDVKMGKGEQNVRKQEKNKAAKRVRDGLNAKQQERRAQQLVQAKALGNYHPALKKLFNDEEERKTQRKRQRGLAMGVGKYSSGRLILTRKDVAQVSGPAPKNHNRR